MPGRPPSRFSPLSLVARAANGLAKTPARFVTVGFAAVILAGALVLMLPIAKQGDGGAPFLTALFYSTSAVCVTGLGTVDLPNYFTHFGQVVIMLLVQIGGFGVLTLTSVITLIVARRFGLKTRLLAQTERGALALGDVRHILKGVALLSIGVESVVTVLLTIRLMTSHDYGLGHALWRGLFHAISSFNNAGFALWSDNLMGFATDWWFSLTICAAVVTGGIGFPVILELAARRRQFWSWSLHTKLTVLVTAALLFVGTVAVLGFEWSNSGTLGPLSVGHKLLAAFFGSVTPRTAGFNTVDYSQMNGETLFVTDMLMFVGGGSGGTAGGIKVTTFALLLLIVISEARGDRHVHAFHRRIPAHAHRQALVIAFLAMNAVVLATLVLMATSDFLLYQTLFEAISAFGTVGLSTGITGSLDWLGQSILIALMFLGRTGPQTLALALSLRERERLYTYPEERPIIG
ncbi:MAG: TrkH family potassium uptake protein [Gaiella sp.]